jgi:F0F1-type ATP synthase gamma subunit
MKRKKRSDLATEVKALRRYLDTRIENEERKVKSQENYSDKIVSMMGDLAKRIVNHEERLSKLEGELEDVANITYLAEYLSSTKDNDFVGALNYLITYIVKHRIKRHGLKYGVISSIVGTLTCTMLEFYRRVASPYEDKKIKENGDVEL